MKAFRLVAISSFVLFSYVAIECFASEEELIPPRRTIELSDIVMDLVVVDGNAADDYILCTGTSLNFSEKEFNLIKRGNQKAICAFCPEHFEFLKRYRDKRKKEDESQKYFENFAAHDKFANRIKGVRLDAEQKEAFFKDTFETELILGYRLEHDISITYDVNVMGVFLQLAASEILGNFYNSKGEIEKAKLCNKYLKETQVIADFLVDKRKRLEDEDYALKVLLKDPHRAWRVDAAYRLGTKLLDYIEHKDLAKANQLADIFNIALKKEEDADVVSIIEEMKEKYTPLLKTSSFLRR